MVTKRTCTNDNDGLVFSDLVKYHQEISELPTPNHYKFLAVWDMHTYLIDKFQYSPIVWFFGITQRGKSRTAKAMTFVSRRGMATVTFRESHILRMTQDLEATIFFDSKDLWKRAESTGVEDVLLNRFEYGAKVPRVLYPERGKFRDTVYYSVYGASIFATNEILDEVMATRTIQIMMPESRRDFRTDVQPEIGLPFRERLCAFRARWMDRVLPSAEKIFSNRLGDIIRPIHQIVKIVDQSDQWLVEFTKMVEANRKKAGADSLDAQVVAAMKDSHGAISHGHLLHEDILANLNKGKSAREEITPQKLGRVTQRLGFEKHTDGQRRGIIWNEQNFLRLCERYGIELEGWL